MKKIILFLYIAGCSFAAVQSPFSSALKAVGAPNNPRVEIAWNRYYDHQEIGEIAERMQAAYPKLVKQSSIGKSVEGREILLLTVTNFLKGDADSKPAIYIDGNIHSNEIQGAEVALYTAWYLVENFGYVEWISDLLDDRTFYIVPTINPDARDHFIHNANNPHSPRSGLLPRDDDGDGRIDEDGYDDLDGDGNIVRMRRRNKFGRYKIDPQDSRLMLHVESDEAGEYELLGWEGFDNDGDGNVNEDGPGYYDPNRNWGWNWQPSYVQHGADQYPFSIPENRAVADFIMAHPNVGAAQSYHNSGGLILRGPGDKEDKSYSSEDIQVYKTIAKIGEQQLPGYRYIVIGEDLYTVYGGEIDWFYSGRGIFMFSNELWTSFDYFRQEQKNAGYFGRNEDIYKFDKYLLFGEGVVNWREYNHPQYGRIEIGGVKKSWTRTAPSFLLEDLCHRNMAFTLFHAYHLPEIAIDSVAVKKVASDIYQIDVVVANHRLMPTRSAIEINKQFTPPDWLKLENASIVAGFRVTDPLMDQCIEQKYHPERLAVETIPGMRSVQVRWLVKGHGQGRIIVDSARGGLIKRNVNF